LTSSRQSRVHRFFLDLWYGSNPVAYALLPLSGIFNWPSRWRQRRLTARACSLPVPVVVVGNITVGGAGKTPVVLALVAALKARKIRVGVISRGYGSRAAVYPLSVEAGMLANHSGDEALLIAQQAQCPVVIDKDRVAAARHLLNIYPETELIISDDGLQHYRLSRDMEIVVVDGKRGIGNGFCLPAGPLREPIKRLQTADWVLINGKSVVGGLTGLALKRLANITLEAQHWLHLTTQCQFPLRPFPWASNKDVMALAAIGNPQRFFTTLADLDIHCETQAFDDHYSFTATDFTELSKKVVLMTTKDAVKCADFAQEQWWALQVAVQLPDALIHDVIALLKQNYE